MRANGEQKKSEKRKEGKGKQQSKEPASQITRVIRGKHNERPAMSSTKECFRFGEGQRDIRRNVKPQ